MDEAFITVWDRTQLSAVATGGSLIRLVQWRGGRGWLVVDGFVETGGVEIQVEFTGPQTPQLAPGLPGPITADGVYPFDLPAGAFEFNTQIPNGADFVWEFVRLIPLPGAE